MEFSRVVSVAVQYGFGAVLCGIGIWCGIRSGYLTLAHRDDRRLLATIVVGFFLLLAFSLAFTVILPHWPAAAESAL